MLKMTDRNRTYQNGRVSTHSNVQCGSANRQTSFSGRGNARIKLPFSGHIANKFRRSTILQLNIEGLTASKMNVTKLPTSWVFFKQEAWPCHVCPRATEIDAFGPISTDIGDRVAVFVYVDGYKIVNVYKSPPTRLQTLDLPVFPHPCLYAGNFNCRHADWGYDDNSPDGECLAGWAIINCLALLCITLLPPDSLDVDAAYQDFCNTIKKAAKKTIPRCYRNDYIPCWEQSVNPAIKPFCSLLRETTQVWLLQLCLPSLTESGGMDDPKKFGALTSHTLVEKRGVF